MYEKRNLTYILTILEAIEKIYVYTSSFKNADEFYESNEQMNFNAYQILLLVIGEEAKKLNSELKQEHDSIPWHLITQLRNRIAHEYRSIDPNISFDIIQNYLPSLKNELVIMLEKVDFTQRLLIKAVKSSHYRHLAYLLDQLDARQ